MIIGLILPHTGLFQLIYKLSTNTLKKLFFTQISREKFHFYSSDPNGKSEDKFWNPVTEKHLGYLKIHSQDFSMEEGLSQKNFDFWNSLPTGIWEEISNHCFLLPRLNVKTIPILFIVEKNTYFYNKNWYTILKIDHKNLNLASHTKIDTINTKN